MPVFWQRAPEDSPDRDKNYLEGLLSGQQREWDDEYVHLETRERRWFHIAMGSEVEGRTKYILVMSDRTADKQVIRRFPMPLLPPRPPTAPRALSFPICPTTSAPP